jgi:DNA-directed RNA polymerase alpha subunit
VEAVTQEGGLMAHWLAKNLRDLATEFESDRNYIYPEAREAFRKRLADTMRWSADSLDEFVKTHQKGVNLAKAVDELEALGLDNRIINVLRNDRLVTVVQLARVTDDDLMRTPGFGRLALKRLRAKVPYTPEGKPRVRVQAEVRH